MSDHFDDSLHQKTSLFKGYLQDMVVHHFVAAVRDAIEVHLDGTPYPGCPYLVSFQT
jgi:hypothetical protein